MLSVRVVSTVEGPSLHLPEGVDALFPQGAAGGRAVDRALIEGARAKRRDPDPTQKPDPGLICIERIDEIDVVADEGLVAELVYEGLLRRLELPVAQGERLEFGGARHVAPVESP